MRVTIGIAPAPTASAAVEPAPAIAPALAAPVADHKDVAVPAEPAVPALPASEDHGRRDPAPKSKK